MNNDGFEEIRLYDSEDNKVDEVSYSFSNEDSSWGFVDGSWIIGKASLGEENIEESWRHL